MMYESLREFEKQFAFEPKVIYAEKLEKSFERFIVGGMGGSNLASGLIKIWKPKLPLIVHQDYNLPSIPHDALARSLFIASSYSGNTEEVLDAFEKAGALKLNRLAISTGGELLTRAKKEKIPYIQLPDTVIEPRMALGLSTLALLKALGEEEGVELVHTLARSFQSGSFENEGKRLALELNTYIPIIYVSSNNRGIAYAWKIAFNESAKIPAFYNVFPEVNHNEMTGFDTAPHTKELSKNFSFIFLKDKSDHPQIQKRMDVTRAFFEERNFKTGTLILEGSDAFEKIFNSIITAYWSAYFLARAYDVNPEGVPLVEALKKKIT